MDNNAKQPTKIVKIFVDSQFRKGISTKTTQERIGKIITTLHDLGIRMFKVSMEYRLKDQLYLIQVELEEEINYNREYRINRILDMKTSGNVREIQIVNK